MIMETIWRQTVPDDRPRKDWENDAPGEITVQRLGHEELPTKYQVAYQMMPGDGPNVQETFGASQKFEALAYARGLYRGLTR